jgi:hypothetical protein
MSKVPGGKHINEVDIIRFGGYNAIIIGMERV